MDQHHDAPYGAGGREFLRIGRLIATLVLLIVTTLCVSGCGYSVWHYVATVETIETDTWSLQCEFDQSEFGYRYTGADTLLSYAVRFIEIDTVQNPRLSIRIDSLTMLFPTDTAHAVVPLSSSATEALADTPRAQHTFEYGPIRLPGRPDEVLVKHTVTIFERETGAVVREFRIAKRGQLTR